MYSLEILHFGRLRMRAGWALVGLCLSLAAPVAVQAAPIGPEGQAVVPPEAAVETLELTRETVATFGDSHSDALGIEDAAGEAGITVLVSPDGEDCTLRFPVQVGESLMLRASSAVEGPVVCEATLVSVGAGASAQFAYRCEARAWAPEQLCPSDTSISAR
jgi:hypothetical protein